RPTRGYEEARQIGQTLRHLAPYLEGSIPPAEVAILHDYTSRWSLDLQPHNRDLADGEAFRRALMGPYEALWARNVPVHILRAAPETDLSAYKLVILPALNLVGPDLARRLREYVQGGGTLIATARTGFKDEYGQVPGQPPGHLTDLMRVLVEEFDSLPPGRRNSVRFVGGPTGSAPVSLWMEVLQPTGARPLAVYEEDFYARKPAATIADVGRGRAIYVGVLAGPEFYGPLMDWLLPPLGVRPPLETPAGVEAKVRVGPRGRVLFLLNHNDRPVQVSLPAPATDLVTGEHWEGGEIGARAVRILLISTGPR
ncbi:MAG: beta-galactosidase trimerization domain-containing protein, partial [Anaerolineae bacterium]|nr:beta-galactosidase trimerization domain-containing protein [Anaerolineae bacterium]